MAIFDATDPANANKVGEGAAEIRDVKTTFNSELEQVVITVIDSIWECVVGWPRIYTQGAAPTPGANADAGRCWLDTDVDILWVHDGTDWNRVGPPPIDIRIPLPFGIPQTFEAAAWDEKDWIYWDGAVMVAVAWKSDEGHRFSKTYVLTGCEIRFGADAAVLAGTKLEVRLYDVAAAAAIAGSTLSFTDTTVVSAESADLTAAIAAGARRLRLQVKTTGGTGTLLHAELRIRQS